MDEVKAYCMKCKTSQTIKDLQFVTTKKGRPAAQGVCPVCGTKMYKFLKSFPNLTSDVPAQAQAVESPDQPEPAGAGSV